MDVKERHDLTHDISRVDEQVDNVLHSPNPHKHVAISAHSEDVACLRSDLLEKVEERDGGDVRRPLRRAEPSRERVL